MRSETLVLATAAPLARRRPHADRLAFSAMGLLLLLVAVVGFAPRSAAILDGTLPNPPLSVHIHAALMSAWLLLFVAQTLLVAGAKRHLHILLGLSSLALVPAMVMAMVVASFQTFVLMVTAGAGDMGSNILLLQIRSVLLFPLLFLWALQSSETDLRAHKRLMLLSTWVIIDAAIARMDWLPGNDVSVSYDVTVLYQFLLLVPALAYDRLRYGRVHSAYWHGIALYLPFVMLTSLLWNTPWWQATAPALLAY